MADSQQDSPFRVFREEIDDDLRQERYAKLWKAYGAYVIAGAIALVAAVAGYQGWRAWDIHTRSADGESFAAAQRLAADDRTDEAVAAFSGLAAEASGGYALLSRFQEAALLARRGDRAAAVQAYRSLSEDTAVDVLFRDLAVVFGALQEMDGPDPQAVVNWLAPLAADDNPWRHSAREIIAVLAYRGGDKVKARDTFVQLAGDATAPRGLRTRAAEMLAVIGE